MQLYLIGGHDGDWLTGWWWGCGSGVPPAHALYNAYSQCRWCRDDRVKRLLRREVAGREAARIRSAGSGAGVWTREGEAFLRMSLLLIVSLGRGVTVDRIRRELLWQLLLLWLLSMLATKGKIIRRNVDVRMFLQGLGMRKVLGLGVLLLLLL